MENQSKVKLYSKKLAIPSIIFFLSSSIVFLFVNFLINLVAEAFQSIFSGGIFESEPIQISSQMIFTLNYLETSVYLYLIVTCVSLFAGAFVVYKYISNFGKIENNQKGSSRFSTVKEIKQQYRSIPETQELFQGGGGVPVARYKNEIFIDDSAVNNLIIGTTRSGKGEMFIFPTIDIYSRATNQASMILNDPKGELYTASKDTLEKLGYRVEVLNLMNPLQSLSYNLLQLTIDAFLEGDFALSQQYARQIGFTLFNNPNSKDPYWQNVSIDLVTALILAVCEQCKHEPEKINMYNVSLLLSTLGSKSMEDEMGNEIVALDNYFNQFPVNHPARLQYTTVLFARGQNKASALSNTNSKLSIFTLSGIAKLTSKSSIDIAKIGFNYWISGTAKPLSRIKVIFPNNQVETIKTDLNGLFTLYHNHHLEKGDTFTINHNDQGTTFTIKGWKDENEGLLEVTRNNDEIYLKTVVQFEKPIALFMIVPDYDSTFNAIASLFVKQTYTYLSRIASNTKGGKCNREVIYILDEFGNMPAIEEFSNILTVCLGRNIRFNLAVQAYSQIEKIYGNDWRTIDGNTNNTFYILTDDYNTAEIISKKIGSKTTVIKSRSGTTLSLNKSKTENLEAKPLLDPNELMRLKEGEMIVTRTIKRQDIARKRIRQYPIYNHSETSMKYRWEYLSEYYDTSKSINEIDIRCIHADTDLNKLVITNYVIEEFAFLNFVKQVDQEQQLLEKKEHVVSDEENVEEVEHIKQEKMNLQNEERQQELQMEQLINTQINNMVKVGDIFNDKYLTLVFKEDYPKYKELGILDFKEILIVNKNEISENNYVFMLEKIQKAINHFHAANQNENGERVEIK